MGVTSIKKLLSWMVMFSGFTLVSGYASVLEDSLKPASSQEATLISYAAKTDQDLNALLADWDNLREDDRRALVSELKLRMIRSKGRGNGIRIRTERRYGRIVRRSDGKLLRIETKVIRVRPAPADQQGFGVGFEQRHARQQEIPTKSAPVLKVTDPSR